MMGSASSKDKKPKTDLKFQTNNKSSLPPPLPSSPPPYTPNTHQNPASPSRPNKTPPTRKHRIAELHREKAAIHRELNNETALKAWEIRRDEAALVKDVAFSAYQRTTVCGNRVWMVYQDAEVRHEMVLGERKDRRHRLRGIDLDLRTISLEAGSEGIGGES